MQVAVKLGFALSLFCGCCHAEGAILKEYTIDDCIKLMTNKSAQEPAWDVCSDSLERADDVEAVPVSSKEAVFKKLMQLVHLLNVNNGENVAGGNDAAKKIIRNNKDLFLKIKATMPKKEREFFDDFDPLKDPKAL
jgi:hypothetical protein